MSLAEVDLESQNCSRDSFKLEKLRILRRVITGKDVLQQRCPNLQHLEFYINKYSLTLENLTQLQTLHLFPMNPKVVSGLRLPSNLKKLVLGGEHIESMISYIAELPHLEYLQLKYGLSTEWCLEDITFHKLKSLKLVNLDISRWNASEESFPMLETLVIDDCSNLKEIPLSFADIPTLKQIKLIRYCKSLEDSAARIKEEVKDIEGCDRINLISEYSFDDDEWNQIQDTTSGRED